ncbi:hypothetical protein [Methanosphaera cuniculi]|uniref:hypothetical protein n=1 Tax=Methanosphaera cuniculi TaxID=1077256 RepID=UPI0026DA73C1|nr:hypothetical protein [Methanosphaera cuniculi]
MWNRIDNLIELLSRKDDQQAINILISQLKQKYKTKIDEGFKFTTICEDEVLDITAIYSDDGLIFEHLFIDTKNKNLSNKYNLSSLTDEINFRGISTIETSQKITIPDVEAKEYGMPNVDVHLYMQAKIHENEKKTIPQKPVYLITTWDDKQNNTIYLIEYQKDKIKNITHMLNLKNNHINKQILNTLIKNTQNLDRIPENTDHPLQYKNMKMKYRILKRWDDLYDMLQDGYENIHKIIKNYKNTYKTRDTPLNIDINEEKIIKTYLWGNIELKRNKNMKYEIKKIKIQKKE